MSDDAEPVDNPAERTGPAGEGALQAGAARKRGRPAGSKDRQPRKKTARDAESSGVREEPITPPSTPEPPPAAEAVRPLQEAPPAGEEAPSAEAMFRMAQDLMFSAKHAQGEARKDWFRDKYTGRLAPRVA